MDVESVKRQLEQVPPVIVIGDLMLDQYFGGSIHACPEGGTKFVVQKCHNILGGAGNVARNLRALNIPVHIIGALGKEDLDDNGLTVLRLLKECGVESTIIKSQYATTVKSRIIDEKGNRCSPRIDKDMKFEKKQELLHQVKVLLAKYKGSVVIVSDYGKGVVSNELMDLLCSMRVKTFVDPKPSSGVNYCYPAFPYLLRPNKKEAEELVKRYKQGRHTVACMAAELRRRGAENVIITLGSEGLYLHDGSSMPALASQAVDVTGAGDTVMASLVAFHLLGLPLQQCCTLASAAAAVVIGKKGTATATLEEIQQILEKDSVESHSEKFI